ncbi:MAG TPA: phosphate regulon sensor histidine kinase PhoR [Candidatus Saccharimonadia bacterium]|nr:phosphate regulon sensor histidine kinase PhoR [Candidatus Saccharimonadia bacterium]
MRFEFLRSHAWQVSLGRFAVLVAAAAVLGWLLDAPLATLATALFVYSIWSLVSLYRMQRWLRSRRRAPPPEDWGVWSDVSDYMYRKLQHERSRKRRLVALLRAFREAAAALPDGVVVLSQARGVVWFNESAARLLGLVAPRDRGALVDAFLPRAATEWIRGAPAEPLADVAARLDADQRLSFRLIPYANQQSLLVVRDITHLARLEQVRRDFVANVSHELRTPLTVLHGYLDMLEPSDAPQWAPMLADLRSQSRRMAQLVEDLLTLSRLEGPNELPDERVPMGPLLAALQREAEALSQGRHVIVASAASEDDLRGSAQYLHSAFSNLVSNAVRYTPPGGRVELRWAAQGDGAEFSVRDTGQGIPAEHLPRITERFYRVSTSRSRSSGGTGLGLSIVKHVLGLHGARLEIESSPGHGSRFACVFDARRLLSPAGAEYETGRP